MIAHFIDGINDALAANEAGVSVSLSEIAEDFLGDYPRITAYPTTEAFDFDLEQSPLLNSIANRVPQIAFVIHADGMCEAEAVLQSLVLAIHDCNYGSARVLSFTWNRDTHHLEAGRKGVLLASCKIPVVRLENVSAEQNTVLENFVEPDGTPFHVDVATIEGMEHVQSEPSTTWRCVSTEEDFTYSSTTAAETPVVTYPEPRVCVLTFSVPRTGRAFFVN